MTMATAVVLALPALAAGQDSYTLKFKESAKGDTARVKKVDTELQQFNLVDNTGKMLDGKDEKNVSTMMYTETILDKPDAKKPPTRVKRVYEKAELTANGITTILPMQGKTVLIERKDNKYIYTYEGGGAVGDAETKLLDKEFAEENPKGSDFSKKFLPSDTMKIGQEVKRPARELAKEFGLDEKTFVIDFDKATASVTLAKIYKKNGSDHGDIVFKVALPITAMKVPGLDIKFKPGAVFLIEFTIAACVDGTASDAAMKISAGLNGEASIPAEAPMFTMNLSVQTTGEWSVVEVKKK